MQNRILIGKPDRLILKLLAASSVLASIVAVFSTVEIFILHGADYFIDLLIGSIAIFIMTLQGGHLAVRSIQNFSMEKARVPYRLFDSIVSAIIGIIFILLVFYFYFRYPTAQWPVFLFVNGLWLLAWAVIMIRVKRYADRLISRYSLEEKQ